MNIVSSAWLDVRRKDGSRQKIAPWQIVERDNPVVEFGDNPVVELIAPRPDFLGALYQLLIGLLQIAFAPKDEDQWEEYRKTPPKPEDLRSAFEPFIPAFKLINPDGPAFLQDFALPDGEQKAIASLLIESPGDNTLKKNLDHFVKRDQQAGFCEGCVATALFTLQTNAPSGGSGHRTGLRGGGPMTTLLMLEPSASLWQKLWLNVLPQDHQEGYGAPAPDNAAVLPWLAPTRLSDKGRATLPEDASPLQAYWGMPRRIRLETENRLAGVCSLCGGPSEGLIRYYRTKNYGVNYEGTWYHPLTPYRRDPKMEKPPLSLKGQQGGLGYRHWLGLLWQDDDSGYEAAQITALFNDGRAVEVGDSGQDGIGLWCFGFDMDNAKARCWYEHRFPVMAIKRVYQEDFLARVSELIASAKEVVGLLRSQIKAAWFERPKDAKGSMAMVDQSFWQATEEVFYKQLEILLRQPENNRYMSPDVAGQWLHALRHHAWALFDHWVLEGNPEQMNMKRIIRARNQLTGKLSNKKTMLKSLKELAERIPDNNEAA